MKIESLSELKKLVRLCRSEGIDAIKIDNIEFVLKEKPSFTKKYSSKGSFTPDVFSDATAEEKLKIPEPKIETPDDLTEEQMLMWSAQGGQ